MRYSWASGDLPVTLAKLKTFLRQSGSDQDADITALANAATRWIERYCNCLLKNGTVTAIFDSAEMSGPAVDLPMIYGSAVTTLTTHEDDGTDTVIASTNYYLTETGDRLIPIASGFQNQRAISAATLVYTAGFGAADTDVPDDLAEAVKRLVALWYRHREAGVAEGRSAGQAIIPVDIYELCRPYRWRYTV
jgi:uncharacterized phiE125 gp8 family phage protein